MSVHHFHRDDHVAQPRETLWSPPNYPFLVVRLGEDLYRAAVRAGEERQGNHAGKPAHHRYGGEKYFEGDHDLEEETNIRAVITEAATARFLGYPVEKILARTKAPPPHEPDVGPDVQVKAPAYPNQNLLVPLDAVRDQRYVLAWRNTLFPWSVSLVGFVRAGDVMNSAHHWPGKNNRPCYLVTPKELCDLRPCELEGKSLPTP